MSEHAGGTNAAASAGIALAMVTASGLCTVLGGALVFCVKATNHRFLSASLGLAAGVMVYVSFVEIFGVKAIEAFQLAGASHAAAARFSTFGFFGGAALTWLLDKFADSLVDAGEILQNLRRRPALARLWRGRTRGGRSSGSGSGGGSGDESSSASAEVVMDLEAAGCKGGSPAGGKAAALPELPAPGLPASSSQVQLFTGRSSTGGPAGAEPGAEGGGAPGPWCAACGRGDADPAVRAAAAAAASAGGAEAAVMYPAEGAALSKLGLLAALAIGIHNLPEGVATFVASMQSPALGAVIVVAIALHNIPEGICIAMPIYYSTGSRWRALLFCAVAGMAEPIGGLLGWAALARVGATPLALAVMFSIVAGMMVFVALAELLPAALKYDAGGRLALSGLYGGMIIMASSLLMFDI